MKLENALDILCSLKNGKYPRYRFLNTLRRGGWFDVNSEERTIMWTTNKEYHNCYIGSAYLVEFDKSYKPKAFYETFGAAIKTQWKSDWGTAMMPWGELNANKLKMQNLVMVAATALERFMV